MEVVPHVPSLTSPVSGVTLRFVDAQTGIRMRVAEAGPTSGTMVLMVHGWPESWFSWRHQLTALASAGYFAVAPDMRGYGGTDAPDCVQDYDIHCIAADMLGLLRHYGRKQAYLVGHDWGAAITWFLGRMYPSSFPALCAMSVPDNAFSEGTLPSAFFRGLAGEKDDPKQHFFYIAYHNEGNGRNGPAEAEYDADPATTLMKLYTDKTVPKQKALVSRTKPRVVGGMLPRVGMPNHLPGWLPESDFRYLVAQFHRPAGQGFRGGVSYYRNMDRNAYLTRHIEGMPITQPVLFIAGKDDVTLDMFGGTRRAEDTHKKSCPNLFKSVIVEDCGHWCQQEKPAEINAALLEFFKSLPALDAPSRL